MTDAQQPMDIDEAPVLFSELSCADGRRIGIAALNRPKAINALNLVMCEALLTQLRRWQSNTNIIAVALVGTGEKGFCAGGDVAQVVREIRSNSPERFEYADSFFTVEYELDYLIHTYAKPLLTWAHGVTMGGGVGLTVGGSHRIVSESLKMAMPEIHIGLFPDVGGGYFLNKTPGGTGLLMAMTGHLINETDAIFAGLADYFIPVSHQATFLESLTSISWGDTVSDHRNQLTLHCRQYREAFVAQLPSSVLHECFFEILEATHRAKVNGVVKGIRTLATKDPRFVNAAANLEKGSPTAAAVVFEYMKRAKSMNLGEVLRLDLQLAKAFSRQHDFPEGVRALLIDKDKKPHWKPATLDEVTSSLIESHFR
jgi:enoyl-CoA hydratase/carnithine racemase